jgi:hypothetical protein
MDLHVFNEVLVLGSPEVLYILIVFNEVFYASVVLRFSTS